MARLVQTNTQEKANLSIKVDLAIRDELKQIATSRDRSLNYIMIEALKSYILQKREENAAMQAFEEEGARRLQAYRETGQHITHQAMTEWAESFNSNQRKPFPKCDK